MNQANELRYLILAAQREGSRLLAEQIRPLGITPAQAEVLVVLHEAQPLSLIEVGERLVCEGGSPSRLVDGMVKAELVQRNPAPNDLRKVSLTLTERGEYLYAQVAEVEQIFDQVVTGLSDQTTLDTVVDALWQFVGDKPADRALARRTGRELR